MRDSVAASTPSPIDAARSGSVGGKHGKGKGTRKNANTGNKVTRSARASCYPARSRGSKQASNPAQKHGLTSKPAQERSQDTLSRKCSPDTMSRPGQTEDMSIHRVMILPDLMLTGAPRL